MKKSPTNKQVRKLMDKHGLTSASTGHMIDADSRTIRRYTGDPSKPGAKKMPWSDWTLLKLITGETTVEDVRKELKIDDASRDEANSGASAPDKADS